MRRMAKHKRKGSVYVEILVAIVMIVLLTQLEVSKYDIRYGGNGMNVRRTITVLYINEIVNALEFYYKHNGFYPSTIQGLEALVKKPTIKPIPANYPEGGYIKRVPRDSWENPFIYRSPGEMGLIDIISCGLDGEEGTEDDITNHNYKK